MTSEELYDITVFLENLKQSHYVNYEDCYYTCPLAKTPDGSDECCDDEALKKGECTCGASLVNERIDEKIRLLKYAHV